MRITEAFYESAQTGKRQRNIVVIRGRIDFDMYVWMQEFNLDSLKLGSVAKKFLGDDKEDIHFTQITPMYNLGPAQRRLLAIYCLKDAELPIALMRKLSALFNAVARARVTGIPCDWVLRRGILVRFTSLLLRRCKVCLHCFHIKWTMHAVP